MKTLSKVLRILVTGSMTMLLQACYGVVAGYDLNMLYCIKTVDINGEAIPELKISYKNSSYTEDWEVIGTTDKFGEVCIDEFTFNDSNTSLKIEDIDGIDNLGDFETKVTASLQIKNYTIEMIKK